MPDKSLGVSGLTVKDYMSNNVICLHEDDAVSFVIRIFDRCHISGAPVYNTQGGYVGMLSKTDLFNKTLLEYILGKGNLDELPVKAIMNPNPIVTVRENLSIEKAAEIMLKHRIHRVFVKDDLGKICGVVSSYDILKVFAGQTDGSYVPPQSKLDAVLAQNANQARQAARMEKAAAERAVTEGIRSSCAGNAGTYAEKLAEMLLAENDAAEAAGEIPASKMDPKTVSVLQDFQRAVNRNRYKQGS